MPDISHLDLQKDIGALQKDIGVLQTEIGYAKEDIAEMKADLRAIRDTITQAHGGWKALAWAGGIGLMIGGVAAKFLPLFGVR